MPVSRLVRNIVPLLFFLSVEKRSIRESIHLGRPHRYYKKSVEKEQIGAFICKATVASLKLGFYLEGSNSVLKNSSAIKSLPTDSRLANGNLWKFFRPDYTSPTRNYPNIYPFLKSADISRFSFNCRILVQSATN